MSNMMEIIKKLNDKKFLINLDETLTDLERESENTNWYLMRIADSLDTLLEELGGEKNESKDRHNS